MKVFLVVAHPEPQSFNGALWRTAVQALEAAGHTVQVSDLYGQRFNPVSDRPNFTSVFDSGFYKQQQEEVHATAVNGFAADVEAELQKLEWCDVLIWQFPLWWFGLPGVLKGWADRVFAMGRTYGAGHIYEQGMFKEKKALLSLTTGGPAEDYQPNGTNGDMTGILRPIQRGIFEFTGFSVLAPHVVYGPARQSEEELALILSDWGARLQHLSAEQAVTAGRY